MEAELSSNLATDNPGSIGEWSNRQLIVFDGFDELAAEEQDEILKILTKWTRNLLPLINRNNGSTNARLPGYLLILHAQNCKVSLPRNGENVRVLWCWGLLSSLEMQLLFRELRRDLIPLDPLVELWNERLLPSIVGDDLHFLEFFLDHLFDDQNQLKKLCQYYAHRQSWHDPAVIRTAHNELLSLDLPRNQLFFTITPHEKLRFCWEAGMICATREFGYELHTAALVAGGLQDDFIQRLWRGQIAWLMPILDRCRVAICDFLGREFDPDWPNRWCSVKPQTLDAWEEITDNPRSAEWGYLDIIMKKVPELRSYQELRNTVTTGRRIRNNLAHYDPVTLDMVREFMLASRRAKLRI